MVEFNKNRVLKVKNYTINCVGSKKECHPITIIIYDK